MLMVTKWSSYVILKKNTHTIWIPDVNQIADIYNRAKANISPL